MCFFMRKQKRLDLIRTYLETVLYKGKDGTFVIFTDPESEKFIQFVGDNDDRLLLIDVPEVELTKDERKRLVDIFGAMLESNDYAFQAQVTIDQAVKVSEKIFREVFLAPDVYNIEVKLDLEK